ncbi:glycosyltransferase family 39 protein [Niastella caeni]|nr:glycosyltransferase family 39 protein [Niastella caeni]
MTKVSDPIRSNWFIYLIVLFAFILRAWNLTSQSLWLDELHNMIEADPAISWGQLFSYLKCCDQHPPLYFIIERLAFTIFSHTEGVARSISVIAGTISVWCMWLLGREVFSKQLGYIAAILTCVNYYNIFYSQEARGYIFAFLFATLSFLYFIKLIRSPVRRNVILYAVFTLLLLYSHYYSLFAVASQGLLALLFIFLEEKRTEKTRLFKAFLFSGIIILVGYAPWVPFLLEMSRIKSFWIGNVSHDFIIAFFRNYFGDAETLIPVLTLLLIVYIVHISLGSKEAGAPRNIKNNPLQFSFIVILGWVFITYLIPYLRSMLVVPILYPRYTIVVLPAILLALALGTDSFKAPAIKYSIVILIVALSFIDLAVAKKYYTAAHKSQFREMTAFVVRENKDNYPVVNQLTSWHQSYYLKKFGSKAKLMARDKEALVDSIVAGIAPQWALNGFWIVGAHGEQPISEERLTRLDKEYMLLKQEKFFDAWAQLFVSRKKLSANNIIINYTDFPTGEGTVLNDQKAIAIWTGAIYTKPIHLEKRTYKLTIIAMGTSCKDEFPHLNIYNSNKKIGDFYAKDQFANKEFTFENVNDSTILKIEMDNDLMQEGAGDRNAFIQRIMLEKQ